MDAYSEIKWSEVAKNAIASKMLNLRKLELIRKHRDKEPFTNDDLEWMDEHDWHPVDEKPMKKSYVKSLLDSRKEKTRPGTIDSLFK